MRKTLLLLLVSFMTCSFAFAQNGITVRGRITESASGEPIIGASIIVKGTSQGTVTSIDGDYSLENVPTTATLQISYLGMKTVELPVNGQSKLNAIMTEDSQIIDEIVVVGYGVQKKSDLTGSVGSIKAKEITKFTTSNPANALQGTVSGVFVSALGAPGSNPEVRIRGIGTTNDSSPLYVVDGMFTDNIGFLNNNDIESMEILKDASATAIYGSRGANGVIIVTTKKGSTGKTRINVTANQGVQFENSDFEMVSAAEYGQLLNEALINTGSSAKYDDPSKLGAGTQWFDEIFRTAPTGDYQVAASGGSENITYNLSAGYFYQEGIIKKNAYDRFTFRANNEYKLSSRVTLGHNLSASFSHKENENKGVVNSAYRISPVITPYDENGNFSPPETGSSTNPLATLEYTNNDTWGNRAVGTVFLNWNVIKGLNFKTSYGFDYNFTKFQNFTPKYYISDLQKSDENSLTKEWKENFTWLWENTLTYDLNINTIHRINLLGGITAQENKYELLKGSGRNFFSDNRDYWYIDQAQEDTKKAGNNGYGSSILSYLARANYALKDRYLLTASIRADGSSKFGPNSRWGYFPSTALGWRISEENFIKDNITWISNLKLRGSWGQIGNDKISNYQYYALANVDPKWDAVFNGNYISGGTVTSLYNRDVHWERSEQLDLGFDLGLFKNQLTLELDYYTRDTEDMLIVVDVPGSVGMSAVNTNQGSVRNKGFDFTARWQQQLKEVNYSIRFTGTTIDNEVIEFGGKKVPKGDIGAGKSVTLTQAGMPIGYFYGYNVAGIFQSQEQINEYNAKAAEKTGKPTQKYQNNVSPGDLIYEDVDGNGFIDDKDRKNIGNAIPSFIGGLGFSLDWRGLDFSFDLQGNFGNKIYNAKQAERYSGSDNWDKSFLDRWTPTNTNTSIPRMTLEGNNYLVSSRYVEDGSYVKLQNIELGYTLPQKVLSKINVQNLRVYIAGNNLLYFTKYNGFTPEITGSNMETGIDREIYPITATCKLGLNLTF